MRDFIVAAGSLAFAAIVVLAIAFHGGRNRIAIDSAPASRGVIRFDDKSGKLVPRRVWAVESPSLLTLIGEPISAMATYKEGILTEREINECPLDKRHVTGVQHVNILVHLYGRRLADFVPYGPGRPCIVSAAFAKKLQQSPFTGYRIRPIVKVVENHSQEVPIPELFYLEFVGKGGRSKRLLVEGAPNLCPHCGKLPLVCPGCGDTNFKCENCNQWTIFQPDTPEYSHPKGFALQGYFPEAEIVEAKDWDGSDFFLAGCGGNVAFVTNRVRDWIGELDAYPIDFKPALLNIEGVEERFNDN